MPLEAHCRDIGTVAASCLSHFKQNVAAVCIFFSFLLYSLQWHKRIGI